MAHRAILVGVDTYIGQRSLQLEGAVGDAISMAKWLVDPAGGAVPPGNVTLLTSPALTPVPPELSGVISIGSATCQTINQQLREIPNKPAQPTDRLYFYFSGHGLTAPTDIAQEAILPADFTTDNLGVAMGVRSILEWLKTSNYNQQFVFIDACRNAMVSQRFIIGGFSLVPELAQLRPQVEQFVYMATSRGLTSAEAQVIGNTRAGVFTGALMDGLQGAGGAKVYNVAKRTYEVTLNRLLPYLVNRVRKQIASLTLPNGADPTAFLQTPTLSGERFSDPVICSFPRDSVKPVTLTLHVGPSAAWPASTLLVERDDVEVHKICPLLSSPFEIPLAPKEYSVTATASAYDTSPASWPLDLYDDTVLEFTMTPAALSTAAAAGVITVSASAGPPATAGPGSGSAPAAAPAVALADHFEMRVHPAASSSKLAGVDDSQPSPSSGVASVNGTAVLTVTTADDSSPLEIECTGNERQQQSRSVVISGTHSITATLGPGIYIARLRAPNGRCIEKMINLAAGARETIVLEAPALSETDPIAALAKEVGFDVENGTMQLCDSPGLASLAWVRLSTILSATANAQVFPSETLRARRLRSLGLNTLQNVLRSGAASAIGAGSAIQVLFGDELLPNQSRISDPVHGTLETVQRAELASISIACSEIDALSVGQEQSPRISPAFNFIGEHSIALQPGCYWLSIRDRGSPGTYVAVTISPNRVTNLILTRNTRGRVSIFAYQPSAAADAEGTTQTERRSEMAQRYLMSGQMSDASLLSTSAIAPRPNANELLVGKSCDPIAGLLGGYLTLRSIEAGRAEGPHADQALASVAEYLAEKFPYFPDSHVLQAQVQLSAGHEEAARLTVQRALEAGIPMFDEGLLRLCKLMGSLGIEHPRTALFRSVSQNRIPGMLWTVCSPKEPATPVGNDVPAPAAWSTAGSEQLIT